MVDLVKNVYLWLIVAALVQTLIFPNVDGDHIGFVGLNGLLASN